MSKLVDMYFLCGLLMVSNNYKYNIDFPMVGSQASIISISLPAEFFISQSGPLVRGQALAEEPADCEVPPSPHTHAPMH